eukprot:Nitzschia sp. Nitz4//scaffold7_size249615//180188//181630//NITZ4_001195-RA/size249615-augustus-gene-0.12-mRNA-1//1//CDS//3329558496//6742//frame0
MKFTAVVSSFFVATASAVTIRSGSEAGQNLMSKARELNNNNNNYYYNWIKDYSIKFNGCAAVPQMEREEGVRSNLLAKFKLCPSDKCGSCPNAGEYVVDMREFVETYQEAKKAANEAACETAEYNCEYACENGQYEYNENYYYYDADGNNNNNKDDGEYCKYQCLSDGGYGFCAQDEEQEGEMNMNEFAECRPMNEDEANNNGYYYGQEQSQIYYLGARCTTSGVYAAVFTDSACTKVAPSGTYEKYNYGYSLPSEPLVEPGCTSCAAVYDDDNNNGYYPNEFCEGLYEQAARCEKNVKGTSYQDNSSCELIHKVIPKLSSALNGLTGISWAKFFAWTFFIVIAALAWYIYRLHKIVIRQKVNLGTLMMGTPAEGQAA